VFQSGSFPGIFKLVSSRRYVPYIFKVFFYRRGFLLKKTEKETEKEKYYLKKRTVKITLLSLINLNFP
jgi:hypothetical protein